MSKRSLISSPGRRVNNSRAKPEQRARTIHEPKPRTRPEQISYTNPKPKPLTRPEQNSYTKLEPKPQTIPKPKPRIKPEKISYTKPEPKPRVLKRRSYGFLIFLSVFALLALGGICAGAVYLWGYLESYEISRPEHIIDHINENTDYDFWLNSAESALAKRLTHFETDASAALRPHLHHILDVRYSIRQRPEESTDDLFVYTVRAGAADIGIIRFKPMERVGHGFYIWGVDSMEIMDSFLDPLSRSITITASQNAQVVVNGLIVPEELRIECDFAHGKTYQINNLFGEVTVKVIEFDGQIPEALFMQHDEYYFPITIPFDVSYNFIVPYGARVYADGERISTDNITDSIVSSTIFRWIVNQSQVPEIAINRYEFGFNYLYVEPVITVTDAWGTELKSFTSDDGEIIYQEEYSETLKAEHEETAKNFMQAYVRFSSNVGGEPRTNLATLGNYMQRSSTLYRHLQNAITTRTWTQISQVTFHEIEADKFRQYGDNYFTCEISYSLTHRGAAASGNNEMQMRYKILFERSGNRWLVVNVIAID